MNIGNRVGYALLAALFVAGSGCKHLQQPTERPYTRPLRIEQAERSMERDDQRDNLQREVPLYRIPISKKKSK